VDDQENREHGFAPPLGSARPIARRPVLSREDAPFRPRGQALPYNARMLGIVLSTVAFLVASYLIKRYLDEIGIPKTMVRGMVVFVLALAVAYGVAFLVDWFTGPSGRT
jgi:hypothetical protein